MIMINTVMTIKEHRNNAPKTDPLMMPPVCAIGCCRLDHDGVGEGTAVKYEGGCLHLCDFWGRFKANSVRAVTRSCRTGGKSESTKYMYVICSIVLSIYACIL